jgi:chemotaxis protein CheD
MTANDYSTYYLFPSTLYVTKEPCLVTTILGSCVAVCLWDNELNYGGINHYMLPLWNGKGLASPKYGNIAIQKLFDRMIDLGCNKKNIKAKVFGGADILQTSSYQFNIGTRNIEIANEYLKDLNIFVAGASVGGLNGRKILFDTYKGIVIQKYIGKNTDQQK